MNTCDYIIDTLYLNGIDTYFVVTGGSIVPFIDAISKNSKVRYYCFQHEQSAAMAAEGYYRSCGKIAGVCVTSGPGVQNILNGVCGCWYDSIPAFFITGQVSTSQILSNFKSKPRQIGFQEMPVAKLFEDVTKKSLHVPTLSKVEPILKELLVSLKTPRYGPVLLDLPVNLQMSSITDVKPFTLEVNTRVEKSIYDISGFLRNSKRPLVVFGHGVILSNASKSAMNFVEKNNIPFVVSWGAIDVCETNHDLRVGTIGVYGDRHANYAIQNADLVIVIGSRLDSRQIGGKPDIFSVHSKKIMVDIDENEIDKLIEMGIDIDLKIIDDVENFFESVNTNVNTDYSMWLNTLSNWKDKYGTEKARESDPVVYDFLRNFFTSLPDECIVISDIGSNMVWTMQCARLSKTQKLFTNGGNASMGFALPAAIGASIGSNKPIYVIAGDGGFQMNIQELLTVKKYNLPIEITILNNSGYGIVKQFQDIYFNSNHAATSKSDVFGDTVDFAKIAEVYGVKTLRDIPIPETQKIYPKLEFGNSLENMTPYIDFEMDMIVPVPPKKKLGWN
jgi:acetolactate synthase-1/2/3 large subunit|tara:strand:+ start:3495 stop:5174 length:1680 start_codon:yes stop_codon:yes gene_type:complete